MARRQPSTNENQLSLFDMLQGTAESQPEKRLALTLTDIGGGAGIFISDEGKDRLNDHAKTLGNEELADAYFQAVRDFEEAGLEGSDRSHLIHNAYLAELSRRRLVRTQPRGLEPIAPREGQPLSIVPWGTGPEQYHLAHLELDPTGTVQAVVDSLAQDYQTLLIKQLGLTQEEARHRYEAERDAITLSPGEIDQLTEDTADLDTSTESTPHPDPVTFNPQNRLPIPQGVRGRAEANIAAIELLRQLETDQRWATADEQQVLAGYTSWGAASAIFNRADTSYTDLRERLAAVTTPDEYHRMEEATLTAFFTSDEIIRPLWSALTTAGYTDGPVLEPGSGTGNFLAHAPHTAEVVGVEIDPIAASISRQLYPDAHIVNTGFERFQPIDESFVAAIGNVPFGDFRLHDPQHNPESHSIHNHFIVKSLNLVQPGGYVAVVTSSFTSDSLSSDARQDMIARADLVTATRLPAGAFRDVAGTDVGTDILVFRKRIDGEQPTDRSARFLEIDQMTLDDGTTLKVNGVLVDNPAAILGEASVARNRWGKPYLKVTGTGDDLEARLTDHLTREIERARGNQLALEARPATTAQQITESAADRESVTPGTIRYIDRDGKTQFQNFDASTGRWEDIKRTPGTNEAEWKALIDLRDTTTALRNAYRDRDESVDDLRNQLNEQYDSYVSTYGALNRFEHPKPKPPTKAQQSSRYNQIVAEWRAANGEGATTQPPADLAEQFRDDAAQPITPETKVLKHIGALRYDPHIYSLLAIEVFDEDTQTAHKGRIFTGDPTPPAKVVEHADNLADGIDISLHQHGTIDPAFIAELTNKTTEQVEEELVTTRHAFRDPANPTAFIRAEAYLSGVVEDKLADAMHKARTDERFQSNVAALTDVLPTRITEGIEIRPGVTWIDESFYRQFISETFEIPDRYFEIHRVGDTWHIDYDRDWWTDNGTAHDVSYGLIAAHSPYRNPNYNFQASTEPARSFKNQGLATNRNDGTVFTALDLFETALNVSSPTVNHSKAWREEYPDSPAINKEATDFAQRRTAALREAFSTWVAKDPERHTQLIDEYNRRFNSYVPARWRPRSQAIPGLADGRTPYSYQRNAVERIINEPAVLLNHVVGAGKTGSFFMGAAELKRLGKIAQPWIVVPNHLAEKTAAEATEWYPGAKVLSGAGLKGAEARRQFIAQTTAEDWDFVIVPESVFSLIPVSKEKEIAYLQAQHDELRRNLEEFDASDTSPTVKQLQRMLKANENRMNKILDRPRDVGLEFEATGCDYLIIDEAHNYKNLFRASHVDDISHGGSNRAADLDLKLTLLREKTADRPGHNNPVVTFATGTPLANNLAEIWVMAKYLRPDLLERAGVDGINAWAAAFTEQVTLAEVPPQGIGLRTTTRTASFINVGDLVALTEPFMDVVTRDQIEVTLPERATGDSNRLIEFELDQEARDFIIDISERAEIDWAKLIPYGNPDAIDLALKQLSDGEKVSLDPRLVNLDYEGYSPRVRAVADEVTRIWDENKDNEYLDTNGNPSENPGGFQIAFLDQGTPKKDGSFNLYDQIRAACADQGMDPSRIEFIHDHDRDRDALFDRCNNGGVDVLIGSTAKLGTGVNIQHRAVALHHVDVPWKPADLEQREGRVIRQKNQNPSVEICNYIARGSTDAVRWQTILRKTQTIDQFTNADRSMRSMEPLESSNEEIAAQNRAAATGDSRYFDLLALDKEVADLQGRYQEWQAARESTKIARHHYETVIDTAQKFLNQARHIIPQAKAWADSDTKTWHFPTAHQPLQVNDRAEATNKLTASLRDALLSRDSRQRREAISIGGIDFTVTYEAYNSSATLEPANLDVPDGVGRKLSFSTTDLGTPSNDGTPTSAEYGAMTRLENFVRSLPEFAAKAETNLDRTRIQQSRLSLYGEDTFPDYDKLLDTTAKRDALQETLAKVDQSAAAEEERQRRAQRLALKGRTKGWSLRLNPTKAYAEKIEFTDVDDLIFQVKNEELETMFHNSVIDENTYLDRKRVLAGVPIETTNREAAPKKDSNHLGAEEFTLEGHSYAPETMTPAERLSLQTTGSQGNQTIVEHDKSTENEVATAGQAEL